MLTNIQSNSPSTIIKKKCPYCSKPAQTLSERNEANYKLIKLQCGHTVTEKIETSTGFKISSITGKEPFPFQYKTSDFSASANYRVGIFHEQGVGKTICALMNVKRGNLYPCLVICKKSLTVQWFKETLDWLGLPAQIISSSKEKLFPELFKVFIISFDLVKNLPQLAEITFDCIIIDECQQIKNPEAQRTQAVRKLTSGMLKKPRKYSENLPQRKKIEVIANDLMKWHGISGRFLLNFEDIGPDKLGLCECRSNKSDEGIITGRITLNKDHAENDDVSEVIETILHEIAHAITPGAGHRPIWYDTAKAIGSNGSAVKWCEGTIEIQTEIKTPLHIMALSGTPIKNNAGEYFTILNILRPDIFPSQARFERDFCDSYLNGWSYRIGGIARDSYDEFKRLTDSWIIRYERNEVLPDLPKIFRKALFFELGKEVEEAYKKAYLEFKEEYLYGDKDSKFGETGNLLAKMARLRHITGISKVIPTADFVQEFLEETDRKIVLFVHHKDVGTALFNHISHICSEMKLHAPLQITSDNQVQALKADEEFKTNKDARVLIASTLSAGEGKNWQMCADCIIVERQWNPANEEQAEGRFPRPGSLAESISVTYTLATGTIDEFLAKLVDDKRKYCRSIHGKEDVDWNQDSLMRELADVLFSKGGQKWSI